jgi:hypothetical protein
MLRAPPVNLRDYAPAAADLASQAEFERAQLVAKAERLEI